MIVTAVGNYPRTALKAGGLSVRRTMVAYDRGKATLDDVHKAEDSVTREVIREQAEAGLDLVTDGQIRWDDAQTYFARHLDGFEIEGLIRYFDTNTYYRQPAATGPIKWTTSICRRDYQFAVDCGPKPVKPVVTGPYTLARLSRNAYYPDLRSFVLDLARALNQEARDLAALKPSVIQFDEPAILQHKEDWPLFAEAMSVLTEGVTVPTALVTYFGDVSGLAPDLWRLPFQTFGLDFVMGSRNFELLDGFPSDRTLGLGIVDARNTKLEAVDQIVAAVRQVSGRIGLDRLQVHPSCGLEFLPRDRAKTKITRMAEAVRHAEEVLA